MAPRRDRGRWLRAAVSGDSMLPGLRDGDWLVCRRVGPAYAVLPGDVVVAERPDRPGLLLVKRAARREAGGWWLLGDNPDASDDSRLFGAVPDDLVVARVILRYWPDPGRVR